MERYMDVNLSPQERAKDLLARLSLDEKMAQLNGVFPFGEHYKDMEYISQRTPHGIGQVSTLEVRRMETLDEAASWQRTVQNVVMKNSPHHIPAVFHMEGLCGAFIQESTSFPSGIGRGAGFNPELEEKIAEVVSRQELACGFTQILAPVLDISRDSRMGRQGETYGEDPTLAAEMGAAYTRGVQREETAGRKAESVAKHFLAFHNSQGGIHGTHSDTPPRVLREVYGKPFQATIAKSDLKGIMPCYCSIDGEPASASKRLLSELLRGEMGFDGVIVSDYGSVGKTYESQRIAETPAEAGLRCLKAGMDVELPEPAGYGDDLKVMFENGEADMKWLDAAVLRVLAAKFRMGLFEHPYALQGAELWEHFGREKDRALSLKSAQESMVLLKNDGVLPLSRQIKRIALIGPHADSARKFFGGYTHLCMMESTYAIANSIAGVSGSVWDPNKKIVTIPGTSIQSDETEEFDPILKRQKPDCRSLLEELRKMLPQSEILYAYGYPIAGADESGFDEALALAQKADVVLLTLGGKHGTCSMASMGEGIDAANINLPPCQDAFIRKAAALGKPVVGIHFDGRPISSDAADKYLNAILEAWNPSEMGAEAVASVLFGDYNPAGRMPVTTAYHAGQIPLYYNHPNGSAWHQTGSIGFHNYVDLPHTPRYYFGYGLSYTTFSYSDLVIQRVEHPSRKTQAAADIGTIDIAADEAVRISCMVENSGGYAGDEVVQLYLTDPFASMVRPVKELAGFIRVNLQPGEKKKVSFEVQASQTAFLDEEMRWKIEKGQIEVEIGASSEDIRLKGTYRINEDAQIAGRDRAFWANVKIRTEF